ncbi:MULTISPECIES: amidohydrolase family protein [unclassified Crossiella]|uniref:amidohydrolase family protein n=1 Tax=unclassified Crossiella TaxID=2620835 RepID=UPI00200050B3|nr:MULTISPECIES: amidohydrolase family protein [unclassified Crossiella]MCK2245090.1 amidohydrolase family protein [Crossiella sp. S99.2]MCK2258671.1 amidohydrolase family protein [Crossiella sp. S99.1]
MTKLGVNRREFMSWMSRSGVALAAAGGLWPALAGSAGADTVQVTVLRGATLIDATGAAPCPDSTVVLVADRIVAVGGAGLAAPAGATIIDLRGKYLLPGFWDMHTHLMQLRTIVPKSHLVYGVTGVREMWGLPESHQARREFEAGTALGPRMVIGSAIIDGPASFYGRGMLIVRTEAEARAAVRAEHAKGAEFVKVYQMLTPELLTAIADEAEKLGLRIAGHLPDFVPVDAALVLRQKSYEHMFGFLFSTSREEAEYRRKIAELPFDPAASYPWFRAVRELERQAGDSFSPAKAVALARKMRERDGWLSPTLRVLHMVTSPKETFAGDERMKYLPPFYKESWANGAAGWAPVTPEQIAQQREFYERQLRLVGILHKAGVGVIGGTDCGNPYCFPGSGLHDELERMVAAGLSPMAALQTVTRDAARYVGLASSVGTVSVGKKADLLVLDADPLASIANTRRIHSVVSRGRVFGPADRVRLLGEIEQAALEFQPPTAGARSAAVVMPGSCC